jgi:hypothetical protein
LALLLSAADDMDGDMIGSQQVVSGQDTTPGMLSEVNSATIDMGEDVHLETGVWTKHIDDAGMANGILEMLGFGERVFSAQRPISRYLELASC